MGTFIPNTKEEQLQMLNDIGYKDWDDLFKDIPAAARIKCELNIPAGKSELETAQIMEKMANRNVVYDSIFRGAGAYNHYIPAAVNAVVSKEEFITAYTPYQAEISQGILQSIFEYQTMICELTGMDVSNASMYDGSTATAEAVLMAGNMGKKANKVLVSGTLDPKVLDVVKTYAFFHGIEIEMIAATDGITDKNDLQERLGKGGVAGVVVQQPNYFGIIEDYSGFAELCHEQKALFIMNSIAADLALLKTPGEWGADIAVGDGQSLGIPMSWGGAYVGYMCCTEKLMRKMPGRIVGKTVDRNGQRAFVLTLQAREQHIRRQKATSNICSNESLMALWVTIYMSLMGKQGLKEAAQMSYDGAHYLCEQLNKTGHFVLAYDRPFFNECCMRYDGDVDKLQKHLIDHGIFGGIKVANDTIMFAVTEKRSREEIDRLIDLCHE